MQDLNQQPSGIQDPTQQSNNAQTHRYQMDLVIAESDYKKNSRRKEELELEVRELEIKRTQFDFEIADRKRELKKIDNDSLMLGQEIQRLKKKINLL